MSERKQNYVKNSPYKKKIHTLNFFCDFSLFKLKGKLYNLNCTISKASIKNRT